MRTWRTGLWNAVFGCGMILVLREEWATSANGERSDSRGRSSFFHTSKWNLESIGLWLVMRVRLGRKNDWGNGKSAGSLVAFAAVATVVIIVSGTGGSQTALPSVVPGSADLSSAASRETTHAVADQIPPDQFRGELERSPLLVAAAPDQETPGPAVLGTSVGAKTSNADDDQRVASDVLAAAPILVNKQFRKSLAQRKYLNRHFTRAQRVRIRTSINTRRARPVDKTLLPKKGRHRAIEAKKRVFGPEFDFTGVVEGFYGRPWSHQERLEMISFLGKMNMNTYLFAPKDETKHRTDWRTPYTPAELSQFKSIVAAANSAGVDFNYGINPGLAITYGSADDFALLTAKITALYQQGVRQFTVMLDDTVDLAYDLGTQDGLSEVDKAMTKDDGSPLFPTLGTAHLYLVDKLRSWLEAAHPDASLFFVPAVYSSAMLFEGNSVTTTGASAYLATVKNIDPSVCFFWTGSKIVSEKVLSKDVRDWQTLLGRAPIIWHNYPVNDWVSDGSLRLDPFQSLSQDLASYAKGILANGMIESAASQIPLYTFGRYLENPHIYSPTIAGQVSRANVLSSMPDIVALWEEHPDVRAESGYLFGSSVFLNWLVSEAWMRDVRAAIFAPADLYGRPGLENARDIWDGSSSVRKMFNNRMGDGRFLEWLKTTAWKIDERAFPFAPEEVWNGGSP